MTWTQLLTLDGEHKIAEPKQLRYRIRHVAGQITRHARRTTLHLPADWPWAAARGSELSETALRRIVRSIEGVSLSDAGYEPLHASAWLARRSRRGPPNRWYCGSRALDRGSHLSPSPAFVLGQPLPAARADPAPAAAWEQSPAPCRVIRS